MASQSKVRYYALLISLGISLLFLLIGLEDIEPHKLVDRLLWPLCRLIFFISLGLVVGQVIEASGWTKVLGAWAGPLFRFANLNEQCSAAFTTAFFSGVAANSMLLGFYKDHTISKKQLFLTNFINQFPAYFLHLPTTFFIVIPLTGRAGIYYFAITFLAVLLRMMICLIVGRFSPGMKLNEDMPIPASKDVPPDRPTTKSIWEGIRRRFPRRIVNIAVYVVPIYSIVFVLNAKGFFDWVRTWMASYVATEFVPIESLSFVILSFAAEFTSGFAAAGALLDAGVLTIKQTVLALLMGNIVAFPVRALRHQLPRYIGIFSPRMGTEILVLGQGFRLLSLLLTGFAYYFLV